MTSWRLDNIASNLQSTALGNGSWRDLLTLVSSEVGGAGALLFSTDVRHLRPICSPDLDELTHLYEAGRWHERDLRYKGVPTMAREGVMTDFDIMSQDQMRRSDYYQDFLHAQNRHWFAGVGFLASGDLWTISIQRSIAQGPFVTEEQDKLKMLWRPLTDAATLSRLLGDVKIESTTEALDFVSHAAIVCDENGAVLSANQDAEKLVGAMTRGQRLTFKHAQSAALFHALLDSACERKIEPIAMDRSITVISNRGKRLTVRAVCLDLDARFLFTKGSILLLLKPALFSRDEILRRAYGFTSTEAAIALLLLEGRSVHQITEERRVSVSTVRVHLKSIFSKSDTRSQAHFVAQASQLFASQPSV